MQQVVAMILAGGRGKRMDLLCYDRPKPVLPFGGKFKVIDFTLSNCIQSRIDRIALLADHQRSSMAAYIERWRRANAAPGGWHILEPLGGSYRGTADAVFQNLGYLRKNRADRVVVLAGDHIYKMDYRRMLAFHDRMKADVTVGVVQVPVDQVSRFGTVKMGPDSRIVEFVEKSSMSTSNIASMGMYIFNADVLEKRLIEDAAELHSPHDFGYAVIPGMVRQDRVFAYQFGGYWQDIGTIEAYYAANMELLNGNSDFSLDGGGALVGEGYNLPAPRISPGCDHNSVISPGCVVKGRVENSILSPGVCVEEDAVVKNSVIMGGSFIGYHSVIDHCILDEQVNVGKSCYLGFVAANGNPGVTVVGQGAAVPSHTAIGCNCKVLPHVARTDFDTNMVPSGTIVSCHPGRGDAPVGERVPA